MNLESAPWGWVDFVTAVVLFVGILRGRKRGLSGELLDMLQWIAIAVVAGFYYRVVVRYISGAALMSQGFYNVCSYLVIVLSISALFAFFKRRLGEKIVGADLFGRGEYYLGMMAGMVRFACIYFVLVSILHAPYYSEQMLADDAKSQQKNFGDIRFPTLGSIQHAFFKESGTGWAADKYLDRMMIQPVESRTQSLRDENSMARKRERTVDAMLRR
jgi:uncharacterized membrane protein required for colicin V production